MTRTSSSVTIHAVMESNNNVTRGLSLVAAAINYSGLCHDTVRLCHSCDSVGHACRYSRLCHYNVGHVIIIRPTI